MIRIKVLGSGCPKCKLTEEIVREAVKELNIQAEIIKVTDLNEIMSYNVMLTPAVIIKEDLVFTGKVPSKEELKDALKKYI